MPATDSFATNAAGLTSPIENGFAIIPHDTNELTAVTRELYVGSGGDIVLVLKNGDEVTLSHVAGGSRLPYRARQIKATGTTASDMVGLY
jgi:hypothetical protein